MKEKISLQHILPIAIVVFANVYSLPLEISLGIDVLLLLIYNKGLRYKFKSGNSFIYKYVIFLLMYTLVVCLINLTFDMYTIGKPIRMLTFYFVLIKLSRSFMNYKKKEIVAGLVLGLIVHLLCVYIQFFIPSTKSIFLSFLRTDDGADITDLTLRAFGLDASFDGAGLNLCVLLVIVCMLYRQTKHIFYFFLGFITFVGCFMVGRTSMVVGSIIFFILIISLIKGNKFYFIIILFITMLAVYYVYDVATAILKSSYDDQSYRPETISRLTSSRMLFLPEDPLDIIFGTGLTVGNSDIGYVKILHMIGIIGLALVLKMYYKCIRILSPLKRIEKNIYVFMNIFLVLLLVYNYKLLLLYSRGINDLFMFLCFLLINRYSLNENNKISNIQ